MACAASDDGDGEDCDESSGAVVDRKSSKVVALGVPCFLRYAMDDVRRRGASTGIFVTSPL